MSTPLRFWKMTGAGNDFVVLDGRARPAMPGDELARRVCARRTAIGADGLLVVASESQDRIVVDYWNADGSEAGFCGNGARCAARFAVARGLARSPLAIVFPALTVSAVVEGDQVEIEGRRPQRLADEIAVVLADGARLEGRRILAGVEHVVFPEHAFGISLSDVAARLFAQRVDLEGQVNVTLVRRISDRALAVRTFERGAGETLACGSGAWAAAEFAAAGPRAGLEVEVVPPAGVPLFVRLAPGEDRALLRGEARFVYEGELAREVLAGRR